MPRYAQIVISTGLIEGDSYLRDEGMEKIYPYLVPIPDDFDLTNKKYDYYNKTFIEYIPPEKINVDNTDLSIEE